MIPYIIADTTYNHEGDLQYLWEMTDELAAVHVDAVKYHLLFDIDEYMSRSHPAYEKIKKMLIPEEKWDYIIDHAVEKNIDVVLLCDDKKSLRYAMRRNDIHEIELHSSAITDYALLEVASRYPKAMMLGIGGATFEEIHTALGYLGQNVTLMYGFNGWSTNPIDINLRRMRYIQETFKRPVGYADHTIWNHPDNIWISCCAALNGFPILEKHYTLTPGVERVDYKESIGKETLQQIKQMMLFACQIYGSDLRLSTAEQFFASKIRKVEGLRR